MMDSPLVFRIPIVDIQSVELVNGWTAWGEILRFAALPVYPWFSRGLIIRRKSGRSLVFHTDDDSELMKCLRLGGPQEVPNTHGTTASHAAAPS